MTAEEFIALYKGRKAIWCPSYSYDREPVYGTIINADNCDLGRIRFMPDIIESPYPATWYFTPLIEEVTVLNDNSPLPLPG